MAADRRLAALDHGLLGVSLAIPDNTTFSRRSASLSLPTPLIPSSEPIHVVLDSTGLKVYGASEWQREKHGERGRRTWRKLHLAVNPNSGEILSTAAIFGGHHSATGHRCAQLCQEPSAQSARRHIQMIQEKGRRGRQKAVGYRKRALMETAMFRYKTLIGPTLRARKFAAQQVEAHAACTVINCMTALGMPISQRVR